jgi:hypothetical protein
LRVSGALSGAVVAVAGGELAPHAASSTESTAIEVGGRMTRGRAQRAYETP